MDDHRVSDGGWAAAVFGEPDLERLWTRSIRATRLDEPDPVAAWREHIARLRDRAAHLDERAFRRDPLPRARHGSRRRPDATGSRWLTGAEKTLDGRAHVRNMPTEEVFTTPHRLRAEGVVRSTMPLAFRARSSEG